MLFKNSEMILKTIVTEPHNREARRALADALIEEGDEDTGNYLSASLGGRSWFDFLSVRLARLMFLGADNKEHDLPVCRDVWTEDGLITHLCLPHDYFIEHAGTLFASNPLLSVQLTDRYPDRTRDGVYWYGSEPLPPDRLISAGSVLANELFFTFIGVYYAEQLMRGYGNVEDALRHLSYACIRYGRKKAGLPELTLESCRRLRFQSIGGLFQSIGGLSLFQAIPEDRDAR